ncbi:MAG TPA: response regulator [Bryobacteraceae bacterium]|nr:response regulator [Bryobacteraceae bacterium]
MTVPEVSDHVLVLAPTGRDAFLICEALQRARISAEMCADMESFAARLQRDAAAALLAEEALRSGAASVLLMALREQPAWSDLPLIAMTSRRGSDPTITKLVEQGCNITLLERPVRMQTLTSAVASALRQRRRQYEVRDRLADEQRTEERMRQTQKLESLGILAGGIAHDFNNLLTGIIGNISLAVENEPRVSPRRAYLEDAIQASERAADLVRQLLAYSGKGRFAIQSVNLSDLVRQISSLIRTSISKNVHLMLNPADSLPHIEADPSQVQQIVMNLIINAAEAIGPETDGLVVVETGKTPVDDAYLKTAMGCENAHPGEYVYVEVRDTGCGIDEATLCKIFDPFFTTKFMGRGLGLAAVLGIVRGHNGALKVESVPGRGSTFRVLFPAQSANCSTVQPEQEASGAGTILVVDDEEIVRRIARNTLESRGYRVVLAENGQIAAELFSKAPEEISLVLLDLTMPIMNGEQTFQRLQRIRPGVKVILSSGYDKADAISKFGGIGLSGFLQKPYTAAQLAESVKRAHDEARDATNQG